DQHAHRGADEVVAMDKRVGDQFFPDDARYLSLPRRVKALVTLYSAGIGADETQHLLEHVSKLAGDVATVDVALVLDLISDKSNSFDDEGGQCVMRCLSEQQAASYIELSLVHQVHVGQQLWQRLVL